MAIDRLFKAMCAVGASDLHLSVGAPPLVRKDGRLEPLTTDLPALTSEMITALLDPITPERNKKEFADHHDTDFAYEVPGLARYVAAHALGLESEQVALNVTLLGGGLSEESEIILRLTEEGRGYVRNGLPERRLVEAALRAGGEAKIDELVLELNLPKSLIAPTLGWVRKKNWAKIIKRERSRKRKKKIAEKRISEPRAQAISSRRVSTTCSRLVLLS